MQHVSQFFLTDVMLKAINVVAVRQIAVKTLRQLIIKATTALSFSGHFILHNHFSARLSAALAPREWGRAVCVLSLV